jgi:hypothetical protein
MNDTPQDVTTDPTLVPVTGIFQDKFRLGEKLTVMVNGNRVHGQLLTYGGIDPTSTLPGNNKDRWFFFEDNWCAVNSFVSGFLFEGVGINYPDGIENIQDPFGRVVGQQNPIGIYRLWRSNDGYLLQVNPYGEDAIPLDALYTGDFHMEQLTFQPD